jgi:SdrD B-like domain/IPTL-CTERM motif
MSFRKLAVVGAALISTSAFADISGVVFQDFNANGVQDTATTIANSGTGNGTIGVAIDKGLAGVTVAVTCVTGLGPDGIYGTADDVRTTYADVITIADGSYSVATTGALAGSAANPSCRVSFTWSGTNALSGTAPNQVPNELFGMFPTFQGSGSNTATQFVAPNSATANLGLNYPPEFCQNNPQLATTCFTFGAYDSAARTHLFSFPYSATSPYKSYDGGANATNPAATPITTNANIGSTWGIAYHKPSNLLVASAYLKRHIGVAPAGLGQIYTVSTSGTVANLVNLGVTAAGTDPRSSGNDYDLDAAVLSATEGLLVGKRGIGDIDFSDDFSKLYAIGLASGKLYIVPVNATLTGTTGATTEVTLPVPAIGTGANDCPAASDVRPFGLKFSKGSLYVGLTCTAESNGVAANLRAYVYRLDASGGSAAQVANFQLTGGPGWQPWDNVEPAPVSGCCSERPQPMVTDIEFDGSGNMILGVRDRFGDITSGGALDITNTRRVDGRGNGDTIRACLSGSTYSPANCASNGIGFYNDQPTFPTGSTDANGSQGGLVQLPGFADVVTTIKDPSQIYSAGIGWMNNTTGAYSKGYEILPPGPADPNGVRINGFKSSGMGDLEALCNLAPLEIGNRIWKDLNGNGVQDPGEPPIAGVTVNLYGPTGAPIAQATTDANGNYYFSNKTVDENGNALPASGPSVVNGLTTLTPNTGNPATGVGGFTICLSNSANYASGGPLSGLALTGANTTGDTSNSGLTDLVDSDMQLTNANAPAACAGFPSVTFATGGPGQNNFGLDAGFTEPVSIGNRIWYDSNNNGTVDAGEPAIQGVRVELFADADSDGVPDSSTPIAVATTDINGRYLFTQATDASGNPLPTPVPLVSGKYIVGVAPSNFTGTGALVGTYSSGTTRAANGSLSDSIQATDASDANNNDHGLRVNTGTYAGYVLSQTIMVTAGTESVADHPDAVDVAGTFGGNPIADNSSNLTVDFGFYGLGIGNLVFRDDGAGGGTANNGRRDNTSEAVLPGVTVILYAGDGTTEIARTTTDANGQYYFGGLPAGVVIVAVDTTSAPLAGLGSSSNNNVAQENGDSGLNLAIANQVRTGAITLTAGGAPSAESTASTPSTATDQTTRTTAGFGTGLTTTGVGTGVINRDNVLTPDNNSYLNFDFSFLPSYSLGNRVWFDSDNSGTVNGSEAGVDGVVVELLAETSPGVFAATGTTLTTANGGYYRFDGLAAGNYKVRVNPANFAVGGPLRGYFTSGTPVANANGDVNNDNNGIAPAGTGTDTYVQAGVSSGAVTLGGATPEPTNDTTEIGAAASYNATNSNGIAAPDNQSNLSIDFGFHKVSIGNRVWFDTGAAAGHTNNGIYDASDETGVPDGTVVNLVDPLGNVIATTTTTGGLYMFMTDTAGNPLLLSGSPADTGRQFKIVVSPPAGAVASTPNFPVSSGNDEKNHGTPTAAGGNLQSPVFTFSGLGTNTNGQVPDAPTATTSQPQLDFGVVPLYSIGNRVWLDTDNSGTINNGEQGKDGVVMNLLNGAGQPLYRQADGSIGTTVTATPITTTTAGGGYYRFDGLPPGQYVVQVAPVNFAPGGMLYSVSTSSPLPVSTGPGANGNDGVDNNSNGIANATPATNGIKSNVVTLGDGTTEPVGETDLGPGGQGSVDSRADMTIDFGFVPVTFALGNVVFIDANNNGIKDGGETGIGAGVTIDLFADANNDGVPDGPAIKTTTTNGDGQYLFSGLPEGKYIVQISSGLPAGYVSSTGINGSATGPYEPGSTDFTAAGNNKDHGKTVSPGVIRSGTIMLGVNTPLNEGTDLTVTDPNATPDSRTNLTVDFGVFLPASLGTVVWIDNGSGGGVSGDGIKQPSEAGIPGVTVRLLDGSGNPVDGDPATPGVQPVTTVTGPNGEYLFPNLIPGQYQVEFVFPPGSTVTNTINPPGSGSPAVGVDNQRNEMDPNTRRTPVITLAPGDNNPNLDSGVLSFSNVPQMIPTLNQWVLILLSLLMLGLAGVSAKRMRHRQAR